MTTTEEQTVLVAGPDFARRRFRARVRRLRPFLYAATALLLLVGGIWLVYFSSVVTATAVDVSGNTTLSAARVERVANAPLGGPLVRVDLRAIQARVESIPAVRSVSVSRSWPHTVHIEVVERVPVAVVSRGVGLQAVDLDGVLFGSYARPPADLPVIRTAPNVRTEALAEAARVIGSLRSDIAARVEHVDVETVDRIRLRLTDGITVMWGSAQDSAQKAEVLAVLLQQAGRGSGSAGGGTSEIDVSVPGRPTTR